MKRWTSAILVAVLVVANGWLVLAPERATSQEAYNKVCGCVYGGGPGGPSGPGTPTCFDFQPVDCNDHSDCPECDRIE